MNKSTAPPLTDRQLAILEGVKIAELGLEMSNRIARLGEAGHLDLVDQAANALAGLVKNLDAVLAPWRARSS